MRRNPNASANALSLLFVIFVMIGAIWFAIYRAQVERDLWNDCHPKSPITTSEAFFADVRIIDCEVER
jgi:hypothetical protein